MTRVLLLEDQAEKASEILSILRESLGEDINFDHASDFSSFASILNEKRFDLIVLDLVVPRFPQGDEADVTDDVLALIRGSRKNGKAPYVVLTQFEDLVETRSREFAALGIAIVEYTADGSWRSAVRVSAQRAYRFQEFDFIIFCALALERSALGFTDLKVGGLRNINGMNCQTVSIGERRGVAVLLARMGLVEAAATSARAIETFRPRLVCMVGICAAFQGRASLGSILFADPVWEHQSGKWLGETFTLEPYQEPIPGEVRTIIEQEIERTNDFESLKRDLYAALEPSFFQAGSIICAFVSGSAVVASSELQKAISSQHKRLAGLDMEMYSVYRACRSASEPIQFFGVKVAVDFADEQKEDRYQKPGATVAARVGVHLIERIFEAMDL